MFDKLDCDVAGSSVNFLGHILLFPLLSHYKTQKVLSRTDEIFAGYFHFYSLSPYFTPLDVCADTEH